jgi:hypothetical protein
MHASATQQSSSRWTSALNDLRNGAVRLDRPMRRKTSPEPAHDTGLTMPHWNGSFRSGGTTFPFTVIGSNPASGTTTVIPVVIIPYRLVFADGVVLDATTDVVDGVTPLQGVINSPIFQKAQWNVGSSSLGTTQWGDAALRANFWSSIPGDRSGYHVLLAPPVVLPVQVINVPADLGVTGLDANGTLIGVVDEAWLEETTFNLNVSLGIPLQSLGIHLMSAIVGVDLNNDGSLGYHWEVEGPASNPFIQPFIQTGYFGLTSAEASFFPAVAGTGVLGHEIAEWLNDPAGDNLVPPWQDPTTPHLCDNSSLEVADPLEQVSPGFDVSLNGREYKLPDVAFLSWFDHERSASVNGWYSFRDTFKGPSAACPVYTNFALAALDITGATTTNLTGVSNLGTTNAGQAVGYFTLGTGQLESFVMNFSITSTGLNIAGLQQVNFPGSEYTVAVKINDRGQIVGLYVDSNGAEHGFLLSNGQYSSIDVPGAVATEALAVNNWGSPGIAGNYVDTNGTVHGFVFAGGAFIPVNANFATNLSVNGLNDAGQITGTYDLGGPLGVAQTFGFTGFFDWLTPLNYPGTSYPTSTLANSLNNRGEVAGQILSQHPNYLQVEAFLEGGGNFQPLASNAPDSSFTAGAMGNNDQGVLVGSFQDLAGTHGAFAIPVQLFTGATAEFSNVQVSAPF